MNWKSGQTLLEVLLAVAVAGLVIPALLLGFISSRQGNLAQSRRLEATFLLSEESSAINSVRERGWAAFAVNGTYHPVVSGSEWTLAAGPETINGLTRSLTIEDVYRSTTSGQIVLSGGVLDPSSKKITARVNWTALIASEISSVTYITRADNTARSETTTAEFAAGTTTNTTVSGDSGGEVKLAANTKGKWCEPYLSSATIDLPGLPNAVSAIEGHVFAATGQTAEASTESFAHVLVGNTDPPTFTLHGKLKGYKTYAVAGDADWGYLATSHDTKEVVIINLNQFDDAPNKIYHEEGYFNTVTNTGGGVSTDANAVFVMNNRGYVAAGQYLYTFDLSNHSGSRPRIGNRIQFANSGDTAGAIYGRVVGSDTYIYIAIMGSTPEELKIANVTNPSDSNKWKIVGSINIEPNGCSTLESGNAVYVNPAGTRSYISSVNDTSFKEFFVIDTNNKSSPSLVGGFASNPPCTNGGGYEANGLNPEQAVVVSLAENRAILVGVDASGSDGIDAKEYQVLDLANEASPTQCGFLQFNQGIYGVAGVKESDGDAFAYLITGDAANELKVVQGGPDGNYLEEGTYVSAMFDAGATATFNRFDTSQVSPSNTQIKYQVAVAEAVSGNCSGAIMQFMGPDATSGTFFATGSAIPLSASGVYKNPGQCFQYKAYLSTTDYTQTPTLNDVTINYSL